VSEETLKSTGVVRKIDELGRVVLPSEIRKVFGIHEGDQLDISVEGEKVILEKRQDLCVFCGAESPEVDFRGRRVCQTCVQELTGAGMIVRLPEEQPSGAR
jgi:AbrB family transcriptional regulator, transcriptional pleiotropic regulator of transition state genes